MGYAWQARLLLAVASFGACAGLPFPPIGPQDSDKLQAWKLAKARGPYKVFVGLLVS